MSAREIKDLPASVHNRLLRVSKERDERLTVILTSYALERFLYRISQSAYKDRFVLKGALVFSVWMDKSHRSTRDLDLLGWGESAATHLEGMFREICECPVCDDGLQFLAGTVQGHEIREDQEYGGIRVHIQCLLGNARIPIRIDIGFGDAVTPEPQEMAFPTLLDFPAPVLNAYPKETVVAEKLQAIVTLGMANSRMKDFYDLWVLANSFEFEGHMLSEAISATFTRRETAFPKEAPMGLSDEFGSDTTKQTQWRAFTRKLAPMLGQPTLQEVVAILSGFLLPPTLSAGARLPFRKTWHPEGPWK